MAESSGGALGFPMAPRAEAAEDISAKTRVSVWLLTSMAGFLMGLRLYCKWLRHRGLWWDDYILVLSWVRDIEFLPIHPFTLQMRH